MKNPKDKILVVDDNPINLKVIASILSPEYSISIANNGMNALKMLEKSTFDLILLDIMMPEMDGFEVCKRIKENKRTDDVPVIFLTAKTDIKDIVKGFEFGAVDYMTKPFNPTEIQVRVKNHLNLYHAKKEIEQINIEKDKFFSIIAHDLRSPLISIVGLSKLLIENVRNGKLARIEKYANMIVQSSELVLDLQNNLLEWAQSQTGRLEFKPGLHQVDKLIEEVAELFATSAIQKSITIKKELPENYSFYADKAMISSVLRNLISNALKYTEPGGTITITAMPGDNGTRISVSDTGVGIAQNEIDKLFHIDKTQSTPGTHEEVGTGLGLILCKEFIERHGGEIGVESEEMKGSTFYFSIP